MLTSKFDANVLEQKPVNERLILNVVSFVLTSFINVKGLHLKIQFNI